MVRPTLIFCDGACTGNPGPGGWGAIISTPDGRVREIGGGERATTNNRMEMSAAIAALSAVANLQGEVIVHTDSTYLIKGITEWIFGWRRRGWTAMDGKDVANRELWEKLDALVRARSVKVKWQYVKGHAGIPGNERCDEIAVAFAQGRSIDLYEGPSETYGINLDIIIGTISGGTKSRSASSGKAYSYLSLLGGVVQRHATWAECERRVKGQPNAKFRKATSREDEATILRSWGVEPSKLP